MYTVLPVGQAGLGLAVPQTPKRSLQTGLGHFPSAAHRERLYTRDRTLSDRIPGRRAPDQQRDGQTGRQTDKLGLGLRLPTGPAGLPQYFFRL